MDSNLKAQYKGELEIGDITISCAVLNDGTRIIGESSINSYLGVSGGKNYRLRDNMEKERGGPVPIFLASKALEPFISTSFDDSDLVPVKYTSNGKEYVGYRASILPKVCEAWLKAREGDALQKSQLPKAKNAEILMRGLAHIGITALVDEATGYQYDRETDELQQILKAYISEELLPWQKKFPDIFYKELFRLNGWDFTVNGIKRRPGVIGKWTKTLIYNELPKGVLGELEKNTPTNSKGKKTAHMHRLLTDEIGNPHLKAQINQMVTLFQLSDDMKHMWSQFEKLKQRQNGQLELPFNFDDKGHTVEPIEVSTLSGFNKNLKTALNYNPKEKE